jgi:uncharacterized protein (TIGR02444 family)
MLCVIESRARGTAVTKTLPPLENPFWRFSLAVYAASGVQDECLALQRERGIDVNILLFCAWLAASRQIILRAADLDVIFSAAAAWHDSVIRPLRAARQWMKTAPEFANEEIQDLRQQIKALELRAEQLEQALLFSKADAFPRGSPQLPTADRVRANIATYLGVASSAAGNQAPPKIERLVAASVATAV